MEGAQESKFQKATQITIQDEFVDNCEGLWPRVLQHVGGCYLFTIPDFLLTDIYRHR